nr:2-phospho-L-lactate guanylyltransferase [Streptomyces sp. SID5476]
MVVPVKPLARAKSRLSDTAADAVRPGLALAFAQDTVAAALAATAVSGVVVVTDDPLAARELAALGARTVPEDPRGGSGDGLNAALRHGTAVVRDVRPQSPVAALNADLPALRPGELTRVLNAAAAFARSFLPDAAGTGTTLLAAAPGHDLSPVFGPGSRVLHRRSGAVELTVTAVDSVRQDVDTGDDLRAALGLGVGPRTAAAAARLLIPGQ